MAGHGTCCIGATVAALPLLDRGRIAPCLPTSPGLANDETDRPHTHNLQLPVALSCNSWTRATRNCRSKGSLQEESSFSGGAGEAARS